MQWIFLIFLLIAACSKGELPTKNCLRISFHTQPTTLDPRKAGDFISSTLICMLYEGLTRCLPGGAVEPALAERVEISENQTVYTFYLRKAFWSDGKPITAYDFEASWKQVLAFPSPCAYLFYPIKNAERYVKGEVPLAEVGIRAESDCILRIELHQPTPYFYSLTAFPSFLPYPTHAKHPSAVFSGPFCLGKAAHASEMVLIKNPTFWNRHEIFLDAIHISIVPDETTALQMFEQGDLDWLAGPFPPDALEKLRDQIAWIPNAATTFCVFNTQVFPFHNLHLRKAFSYAIRRSEIGEKEEQIPATSILPPSLTRQFFSLSDAEMARFHFQLALKELQITPDQLETLKLYYRSNQMEKRLAQIVQRHWKEVLGITVPLVQLDFKSHAHRLQNRDYQIALAFWIAQFDDPISILERFKDKVHLKNYSGWEDPHYIRLLNEAACTPQKRKEFFQEAESLFASQVPLTPIYHWNSPALCGPRVQAIGATPCGGILFERFRLLN